MVRMTVKHEILDSQEYTLLLQGQRRFTSGAYNPENDIFIISGGWFFKKLCKDYNRSPEKQICYTISHEVLHSVLNNEQNVKVCSKFDRIAPTLYEYGVW